MSSFLDVTGTGEDEQKESTPKEYGTCSYISWA